MILGFTTKNTKGTKFFLAYPKLNSMDDDELEYKKVRRELLEASNALRRMNGEPEIPVVEDEPPYCSFCGKGKNEYRKLISGPEVCICDECVISCVVILKESGLDIYNHD